MNHSIIPRVQQVEADFLNVLSGEEGDMELFAGGWESLATEIEKGVECGSLDESTMKTIYAIASRVSILSETFLQYQTEAKALASDLMSQLEQTLSNVTLEDSLPVATPGSTSHASSASYVESSYHWLLQNLYNPYPSKKTKEFIACQAGFPVKDIDSWFVEARRKIGWNALRRSHFNNKRQSIVEAASRFFRKSEDAPLPPDLEVEFANVRYQAENLYRPKFFEQGPLSHCSGNVDHHELSNPIKRHHTPSQSSGPIPASSYLNPSGRLPSTSNSRLTCGDTSSDFDSRASSIAPSQSSCSSPASYTDCLHDESPAHLSLSDNCNLPSVASRLKRKRRLSLSDGFDISKRPRTVCFGPQPHIVSDPLNNSPATSSPESLFDRTDLPPSLEIDLFDPSELFSSGNDILRPSIRLPEPSNQPITSALHWPLVQSQRKTTTGDLSYDPSAVSVVGNHGFGGQILPQNDLPFLDIALDGLPGPLDWLTPFLDEITLNRLLEPNPTFQLDLPSIDDVFAHDFSLPSEVY